MNAIEQVEILLVEDNPHDGELALRVLKKHNLANQIVWVRDGAEALDFIFCDGQYAGRNMLGQPSLLLLDLKLPKVDGLEVLRRVKGDERTRTIPVVVLTSSQEERDMVESYKLGVNSYIVKPVDFGKFTDTVVQVGLYWVVANKTPRPAVA